MKARSIQQGQTVTVVALLIATALMTLIGVTHVARRQEIVRLGYELSEANAERRRIEEENRRLRLEQSVLTNPERIERLARSLGMVAPGPEQVRVVDADANQLSALEWPRR